MTTKMPEFQISPHLSLGLVTLNVAQLDIVADFYQKVIGLKILQQTPTTVTLGTQETPLLQLLKINAPLAQPTKAGLFHLAFLVPREEDLAAALAHYRSFDIFYQGSSNHGYSEALYLQDPEGNGLEVYWDQPVEKWDIRGDGEIVGVTLPLNEGALLEKFPAMPAWSGLPTHTKIGHLHLRVQNLAATEDFYVGVLGLSLKSNYGQRAKFFAAGSYHHHLGANTWQGENLPQQHATDLGLISFTLQLPQLVDLHELCQHWRQLGVTYQEVTETQVVITDPNGLALKIIVL